MAADKLCFPVHMVSDPKSAAITVAPRPRICRAAQCPQSRHLHRAVVQDSPGPFLRNNRAGSASAHLGHQLQEALLHEGVKGVLQARVVEEAVRGAEPPLQVADQQVCIPCEAGVAGQQHRKGQERTLRSCWLLVGISGKYLFPCTVASLIHLDTSCLSTLKASPPTRNVCRQI